MQWLGLVAAVVLAATLAWAAVAKLRALATTEASFVELGVPGPFYLARIVPITELVVAVLVLALPGVGAPMALVLLAIFSAFLAVRLASGTTATCACFGTAAAAPLSYRELARNAGLAVLAVLALFSAV